MKNHSKNIKIIKHREGQSKSTDDFVAIEEPLEIRIENKSIAIVMRTPGHDQELTAGFLLSEGAIKSLKDIFEISECINQSTNNNETGNMLMSY
jgi:FdhD protein